MALTMTRTRTQTTLTRLVEQLARINGELDFIRVLLHEAPDHRELLRGRKESLLRQQQSLVLTLRQFDPSIATQEVVASGNWWAGRRPRTRAQQISRYLQGVPLS